MPSDDLTDELADRIAEEVAAAIPAHYSPEFRELLVPLYVRQALGLEQPAGEITRAALAATLGVSGQRVLEIEALGLARLYRRHAHTLREFI